VIGHEMGGDRVQWQASRNRWGASPRRVRGSSVGVDPSHTLISRYGRRVGCLVPWRWVHGCTRRSAGCGVSLTPRRADAVQPLGPSLDPYKQISHKYLEESYRLW